MFSNCYWTPWSYGLCILWSYFSSHTVASELSDVLTPGNPHAQLHNRNTTALPPVGWAPLSRQVMGQLQHCTPGGRRCWVRCRQRPGRVKASWSTDLGFILIIWGISRPKRTFGVMKCWPALFVNPFLICLIHVDAGLCAGTSKTSLWSKENLIKHILLFFMIKSVWVIFSDQM